MRVGRVAAVTSLLLAASAALGDPVPVLSLRVRDHAPSPEALASATVPSEGEPLRGAALEAELAPRFGRFAPRDDVLRDARAAATAAYDRYFTAGAAASRRPLVAAVEALEAAPDALALVDANREAYLRALLTLARVDMDRASHRGRADPPPDADGWIRRALRFDAIAVFPDWCPPALRERVNALRTAPAPPADARGTLVVRAPREGCTAEVDGRPLPETAREHTVTVTVGEHRVMVRCESPSRVRRVTVAAGETARVSVDPRLDAAVQVEGQPGLAYATEADAERYAVGDAAAVGEALGRSWVVLVAAPRSRVIDVARVAEVEPEREAVEAPTPPPVVRTPARGPGAGPWVLVGAGVVGLGFMGVGLALRADAVSQAEDACPNLTCDRARSVDAQPHLDDAQTWTTAAVVSGAVGAAAVTGGLLWWALAPRRAPAVTVSASVGATGTTVGVAGRF